MDCRRPCTLSTRGGLKVGRSPQRRVDETVYRPKWSPFAARVMDEWGGLSELHLFLFLPFPWCLQLT